MTVSFRPKRCWSLLLAALLASASSWAQEGEVAPTPEGKLTAAIEVLQQFDQGAQEVEVIVNLTPPGGKPNHTEWNSRPKLRGWQRAVRGRQDEVLAAIAPDEFKPRHFFQNQSGFSGRVTRKGLAKLALHPRVASIEYSRPVKPNLAQAIPRMNGSVYRSTYDGTGVAIAIIDSGIDYTHPFLGDGGFPNGKVIGGRDVGDSDNDPAPGSSAHGTACAGIAAGNLATNQGDYIGGVAPGAKLYALKITSGASDLASDADIIAAWNWCITHKNDDTNNPILAISTSYGGGKHAQTCDGTQVAYAVAAANAVSAGITILVASGNDGFCDSLIVPACVSSVISVGGVYDIGFGTQVWCIDSRSCVAQTSGACGTGASTSDTTLVDKVARYSNAADFLTLLAPSHKAHTTDIKGAGGFSGGDYYLNFGGTSASAPYAAGAVAALQSAARAKFGRHLTVAEVRTILASTGDPITDSKAPITKPRLNLGKAIDALTPPRLSVQRVNNRAVISWPTNNTGDLVLQWAHAFPAATWSNYPGIPITVGTNRYVTNNIVPTARKFYRLGR